MSDVPTWRLFAYMDDDENGEMDERRLVADWQVEGVLRWCRHRGFDHIYLCRDRDRPSRFKRGAPSRVRHHMHLVEGDRGRGSGDDAA